MLEEGLGAVHTNPMKQAVLLLGLMIASFWPLPVWADESASSKSIPRRLQPIPTDQKKAQTIPGSVKEDLMLHRLMQILTHETCGQEDTNGLKYVNSACIVFDKEGLAYTRFTLHDGKEPGRFENKRELFTGISRSEGEDWQAEVTYEKGVLHGPVVVTVSNVVFSMFEHVNGAKVFKEYPRGMLRNSERYRIPP